MRWLVLLLLLLFVPAAGAWTWPVQGPVLQTFSFDQAHPYDAGQHRGIAIGAGAGAPVLAPAAGVVSFAGTVPTNGKTLTIQTPSGLAVSLTHLGSIGVARDASVDEGAVVGTIGPSGTPEFDVPYVHLGIRDASNDQGYLDPLAFLPVLAPPAPAPAPASAPQAVPATVPAAAPVDVPVAAPADPPALAPPATAPSSAAPNDVPVPATPVPVAVAPPIVDAPAAPPLVAPQPAAGPEAPTMPLPASPPALEIPVVASSDLPAPSIGTDTPVTITAAALPAPVRFTGLPGRLPRLVVPRSSVGPSAASASAAPHAPSGWQPLRLANLSRSLPAVAQSLTTPGAGRRSGPSLPRHPPTFLVALFALVAGLACLLAVRMISNPHARNEGARPGREDPHRAGLAVRERPASHRPRGRVRGARRRVRALSPVEGLRRPDGERDGRARHAGDGLRRPNWRIAA
jgi:hypothetical protein